jgi:hypothetical protein
MLFRAVGKVNKTNHGIDRLNRNLNTAESLAIRAVGQQRNPDGNDNNNNNNQLNKGNTGNCCDMACCCEHDTSFFKRCCSSSCEGFNFALPFTFLPSVGETRTILK